MASKFLHKPPLWGCAEGAVPSLPQTALTVVVARRSGFSDCLTISGFSQPLPPALPPPGQSYSYYTEP